MRRSWPARWIKDNIVFSADDGAPWAVYRLGQEPYAYLSVAKKRQFLHKGTAMLMALPRNSMILAVHREEDVDDLHSRLLNNVDPNRKEWARRAKYMVDRLDHEPVFDRHLYLVARLDHDEKVSLRQQLWAAWSDLFASVGAKVSQPSEELCKKAKSAARLLETTVRSANVSIEAATPAEIRWLFHRSVTRGLQIPSQPEEHWVPKNLKGNEQSGIAGMSSVAATEAVFLEGGATDDEDRPHHRRYLRVETEAGTSYQAFHVMSQMPSHWEFPGGAGEFCLAVEQVGFQVDWALMIESVPNAEAAGRARRKQRELQAQFDEWDADPSGAPETLSAAVVDIEAQHSELHNSTAAPEMCVNVVFGLGADNLADLEEQSESLRAQFEAFEYGLPRPTGEQWELYRAMLPAATPPPVFKSYYQVLMPKDLASSVPTAGTQLGDPYGILIGRTSDSGAEKAVLAAPEYGPRIDRSASLAICGALGSGKSYFAKSLADNALARGARLIAIDRTSMGEYVAFAKGAPGNVDVVQITEDADVSLDPLRLFPREHATAIAKGFLSLLCQVSAMSPQALVLGEAVDEVAAAGGPLADVIDKLANEAGDDRDIAREVARMLNAYRNTPLGGLMFDPKRSPAQWDADFTVIHTPGLNIPDREQLMSEHLSKQLLKEQIFAVALLYAIAGLCRHAIFEDPKRHAVAIMDEAWWLTASMQGEALLKESIRDGRKHNAGVWLISQSPEDFSAQLAALFGSRAVFRQGQNLGKSALDFLGLHPSDDLIELVETRLRKGECLYQDVQGRTGRVQIDRAPDSLHKRINTNPDAVVAADGAHRNGSDQTNLLKKLLTS